MKIRSKLLALALLAPVSAWARGETLCYIPGAGGGSEYTMSELPVALARKGIPTVTFNVGRTGLVQERAQTFVRLLEAEIRRDASFRCHVAAFSMGGVLIRYAVSHLDYRDPWSGHRAKSVRDRILSITTLATPHRGTPLPRILSRFARGKYEIDEGDWQMNEDVMARFNDPKYPETYSPLETSIPFYSVRLWIPSDKEALHIIKRVSFRLLRGDLLGRGLDPMNDTVVPTASQGFGREIATLRLPHAYFSALRKSSPTPVEFYERVWKNARAPMVEGDFARGLRFRQHPEDLGGEGDFETARSNDELF